MRKTFTDLIEEYQDFTEDDSATNRLRGIRRMNAKQKTLLADQNYWFMQDEYTFDSQANVQSYWLPLNYLKLMTVRATFGGIDYPVEEVQSAKKFDIYNREGTSLTSNIPLLYHVREGKIIIYPTPATANINFTLLYQKKVTDMSQEDYTTGTVAVTQNASTVTGTTTSWTSAMAGSKIFISDAEYEILSVASATSLTLVRPYLGTTASGLSYTIADVPDIPEEYEDILWMSAVADYYLKRNSKQRKDYQEEVIILEGRLKKFGQSKTHDRIWNMRPRIHYRSINDYPQNIG